MTSRRISHRARANGISRRNPYGVGYARPNGALSWLTPRFMRTKTANYAHAVGREALWYSRWQRCVAKQMNKKGVVAAGPEHMDLDPSSKKCDYRYKKWVKWVGLTGSKAGALRAKREQQMKDTDHSARRYTAEEERAEEVLALQTMTKGEAKKFKRKKKELKAKKLAKQGYLTADDLADVSDEALGEIEDDMTMTYVALGGGVLLIGGLAWFLLSGDDEEEK